MLNYVSKTLDKGTGKSSLIVVLILLFSVAFTSQAAPPDKIVIGDAGWNSSLIQNRIAGFIIEHGYNLEVGYQYASTPALYTSLKRGDIHVYMESWTSSNYELYVKLLSNDAFIDLGPSFTGASEGFYVPTYVIEGDKERGIEPMAPGLKTIDDLPKYWEVFKDPADPDQGRIYNCPSSWTCYGIVNKKIKGYGLDKYYNSFDPGSGSALASEIMAKYEAGEPILTYYWEPTKVMGKLDLTKIKEPEYDKEVWAKDKTCAWPSSKVDIIVNPSLSKHPQVMTFLANYEIPLKVVNELLAYMTDNDISAKKTAKWFLENHKDIWQDWIPVRGPYRNEIINKVEEAL